MDIQKKAIKEKLLKDSHTRSMDDTGFIDKVVIDTRKDTHDVVTPFVRGMPVGQLVVDKTESVTLSRRLIPESLSVDKEPGELMHSLDTLASAYFELVAEVVTAIAFGNTSNLSAFMRRVEVKKNDPDDLHARVRSIVRDRQVRLSPEAATAASTLLTDSDRR